MHLQFIAHTHGSMHSRNLYEERTSTYSENCMQGQTYAMYVNVCVCVFICIHFQIQIYMFICVHFHLLIFIIMYKSRHNNDRFVENVLKGLVHPKMKIKSLITHPHAVPTP